jgi:hypothetical protein
MEALADFYTTEEAADELGVTVRRVQQMLDDGHLTRVARGLVDGASLDRYKTSALGGRTRVWAERTAWGAVAVLGGVEPGWLGAAQLSRLRRALRTIEPADLVARTRERATVRTYRAHPAALDRIREEVVVTDSLTLGLVDGVGFEGVLLSGLSERDTAGRVSGYCASSRLEELVERLGLTEAPDGSVLLRSTTFDLEVVRDLASEDRPVLVALDAATSVDPRERGTGLVTLSHVLDEHRR